MLSRTPSLVPPKPLPQDWCDQLSLILQEMFEEELKARELVFETVGKLYEDEMLVVVSLISSSEAKKLSSPISCFLSCDRSNLPGPTQVKEAQEHMSELFALFFQEILDAQEWSEYEVLWQEVSHKNKIYFWKISRENVALTLEADQLLKDAGFDPEEF